MYINAIPLVLLSTQDSTTEDAYPDAMLSSAIPMIAVLMYVMLHEFYNVHMIALLMHMMQCFFFKY